MKRLQLFLGVLSIVPLTAVVAAMLPMGAMDTMHQ